MDINDKEANPYQAPRADITPRLSEQEKERLAHLRHETAIRSIGLFFYLAVIFTAPSAIGFSMRLSFDHSPESILLALSLILLTAILFITAYRLRRLDFRAKLPATVIALLLLIMVPIGTILGLFILYALHCKKGRRILSEDYRDILSATPDMPNQAPGIMWFFLLLIFILILAAVMIPMF